MLTRQLAETGNAGGPKNQKGAMARQPKEGVPASRHRQLLEPVE
jgi:hypothetical protein